MDILDRSNYNIWVDLDEYELKFPEVFEQKALRIYESARARKNRSLAQIREIQKYGFRAEAYLVDKFRVWIL